MARTTAHDFEATMNLLRDATLQGMVYGVRIDYFA